MRPISSAQMNSSTTPTTSAGGQGIRRKAPVRDKIVAFQYTGFRLFREKVVHLLPEALRVGQRLR